jgi:DNA uptake protein ComE-like DNA-binding protein
MSQTESLWDRMLGVLGSYWFEITLAVLGITGAGIGYLWWQSSQISTNKIEIISAQPVLGTNSTQEIYVDISGEVVNPGVYKLIEGMRINDLIASAGGLTPSSDTNWIASNLNRAEKLRDGMKIFIPAITENESKNSLSAVKTINANTKIDINKADSSELENLPGIGPVTAKKIIDNRPYKRIEDLKENKIVSAKVFEQIKDLVVAW